MRILPVSPERLDLAVRYDDTSKGDKCDDDQGIDKRGENRIRRIRSDGLSDCCVEEFVHDLQPSHVSQRYHKCRERAKPTITKKTLPAEYADVLSPGAKYQHA